MEIYAWDYAVAKGYNIPKHKGRIGTMHMSDLFNMTAGTSTGSLIAAALAVPTLDKNNKPTKVPKYYSYDIKNVYTENGQ